MAYITSNDLIDISLEAGELFNEACDRGLRNLYYMSSFIGETEEEAYKQVERNKVRCREARMDLDESLHRYKRIKKRKEYNQEQKQIFNEQQVKGNRRFKELKSHPTVLHTLKQACKYAGLSYNTIKNDKSKQPNGGEPDAVNGTTRYWELETINAWIKSFTTSKQLCN